MVRARFDRSSRWVLASDASCQTCRQISHAVSSAAKGRLEIRPLTDPEVQRWREQSFGTDPAWKPALFQVRGDEVRGWAGQAMVAPLVFHLGLRSTVRVVAALGRLKQEIKQPRTAVPQSAGVDRKQFLRFGAGIAVAAGLVMTGRNPAFAEKADASAQAWVEANRARLPQTYDAVVEYSMPYRREIFRALSPKVRSRLWVTQLDRFSTGRARAGGCRKDWRPGDLQLQQSTRLLPLRVHVYRLRADVLGMWLSVAGPMRWLVLCLTAPPHIPGVIMTGWVPGAVSHRPPFNARSD